MEIDATEPRGQSSALQQRRVEDRTDGFERREEQREVEGHERERRRYEAAMDPQRGANIDLYG